MNDVLKQTETSFTCVGIVDEVALKSETVVIDCGPKDNKVKKRTEQIKGRVSINIGSGVITFFVNENKINFAGNDNYKWNMVVAMKDNWKPKETKVCIRGNLSPFDRFNQANKVETSLSYRWSSASTKIPDEAVDGMNIEMDAFVNSVKHETKDGEDTGRLLIEFLCVDYKGQCYPVNCVAEADAAELLEDGDSGFEALEKGQTRTGIKLEYTFVNAPSTTKKAGRTLKKNNGPDPGKAQAVKTELVIYEIGEYPVEEPEEKQIEDEEGNIHEVETLWIDPKVMKKAIREREARITEMEKKGPEKKDKGSDSKKGSAADYAPSDEPGYEDF